MKLTFGRKFLVMVIIVVVLLAILVLSAFFMPNAVNASVLITYGILLTTAGLMYVGGNVWKSWIKSKYFRQELDGR